MKKIYFVSYMPLIKKLNDDFYLSELKEQGFDVKYLDITAIFFKDFKIADTFEKDYVLKFDNYGDLENFLRDNSDALYVILITYEFKVLRLYRLLKKYNLKTVFFARYGIPICFSNSSILKRISFLLKNPKGKILDFLKYTFIPKLALKLGWTKNYEFVFCAGEVAKNSFKKTAKELIEINFFDYEKYQMIKNKEDDRLVEKKYCIYLDEYLPHHPDLVICDAPRINPDNYYKSMNRFFDLVEKNMGVEVVIAAHPKSDYSENPFNNRKIFKYQTAELVKYSEFNFTHASTSTGFPVFFKKPVFFIYTEDIRTVWSYFYIPIINQMADVLGRQIFNIDEIDDKFDFKGLNMNIDEKLYWDYINNYFTTPKSENLFSKDIVIDFLKNYR